MGAAVRRWTSAQQIDDFDILMRLGQGAFASVFLARQRSMQRLVALKVSRDHGDETQTLAQLDHPNIVRVFDQRVLAERQLRLMYMQHVPGGTLQAVVDQVRADTGRRAQRARRSCRRSTRRWSSKGVRRRTIRRCGGDWRKRPGPQAVCWMGARLAAALDYAHRSGRAAP